MKTTLIRTRQVSGAAMDGTWCDTCRAFHSHESRVEAKRHPDGFNRTLEALTGPDDWRESLGIAAAAIIDDPSLPPAMKKKRVLALLKLLDDADDGDSLAGEKPLATQTAQEAHSPRRTALDRALASVPGWAIQLKREVAGLRRYREAGGKPLSVEGLISALRV